MAILREERIGGQRLILGDCLECMKEIAPGSVDMVLADIPYGEVDQQSGGLRHDRRGRHAIRAEVHRD